MPREVLKAHPRDGAVFRMLAVARKIRADDPLLADLEAAWASPKVKGRDRAHLGFALAKAMEDTGQHARLFDFLNLANAAQRTTYPEDIAAQKAQIAQVYDRFADADLARAGGSDRDGFGPLLVTGLPRSGTTLVEEILVRHSAVEAAGYVPGRSEQVTGLLVRAAGAQRVIDDLSR